MTIEDKVKDLILSKYKSVREFSIDHEIPYTTIKSMLTRGIGNSSIGNVIKLCKALNISVDALADGKIVPAKQYSPKSRDISDRIEIKELLSDTKDILTHCDFVTLDGKPITVNGIDSIIDAIDIGVEMAKKKQ